MNELYRSYINIIENQADEVAKAINSEIKHLGQGFSLGTDMML